MRRLYKNIYSISNKNIFKLLSRTKHKMLGQVCKSSFISLHDLKAQSTNISINHESTINIGIRISKKSIKFAHDRILMKRRFLSIVREMSRIETSRLQTIEKTTSNQEIDQANNLSNESSLYNSYNPVLEQSIKTEILDEALQPCHLKTSTITHSDSNRTNVLSHGNVKMSEVSLPYGYYVFYINKMSSYQDLFLEIKKHFVYYLKAAI